MKLDVFFDYLCPFCERAHPWLIDRMRRFAHIEINWCACEAHPRSEDPSGSYRHSDKAVMAMHYVLERGGDILSYHDRVYRAVFGDRFDIGSLEVLSSCVEGLVPDMRDFAEAINSGRYTAKLAQANTYAYDTCGVWAVPSYVMDGRRLDSIEGVGITPEQLERLLAGF